VAILPLSKKAELIEPAARLAADLRKHFMLEVDVTQSIGRRYRRQDEIGTPFAVTVDFDTLTDEAVTIRHRDTMGQDRIPMTGVRAYLTERLG
jgi:glycyl-tRNA synthetase